VTVSIPEFRAARCTRYRFRYSACRRCADACPHDAVTLSDEGIALDAARCQNCGLCVSACRTAALAAANLAPIDLLKRAIRQPAFSFSCAPSQREADAVVPCLGALDAATLAYLAKRRIPTELRGSHHCPECPHGSRGAAQLALNLEALGNLRAAAGDAEPWIDIALPQPEAHDKPERSPFLAARRQLFRRFVGRAADALAQAGDPVEAQPIPDRAIRAGAPLLTEQRELLQIVGKTADGASFVVASHEALPLLDLELAPGCTACEACFRVCPTGALLVVEDTSSWALSFDVNRCVGCEVCLEACQPAVLRPTAMVDAVPGRSRIELHRLAKQRCARCDRFFISPEAREACEVCTDDDDAFAAIFG